MPYFTFQKRKFIYNPSCNTFEKIAFPIHKAQTLHFFHSSRGLSNDKLVAEAIETYGINSFDIPIPSFIELFKEHAVAPFFVFQLFCVCLWFMDEMWYYSIFTLVMLVVFESTVVFQVRLYIHLSCPIPTTICPLYSAPRTAAYSIHFTSHTFQSTHWTLHPTPRSIQPLLNMIHITSHTLSNSVQNLNPTQTTI